tara:strand:- start:13868 stop:14326 length:459 start_codon:yes stop_codon:yes gene_type:complete
MVLGGFMFNGKMDMVLNRKMCHIVVVVPAGEEARNSDWPDYSVTPNCIFEASVGNKSDWPHEFDEIARSKARQLWRGQNTDGNTDSMAHLLFPGDTPYWGGVKRHGIVVACSGVQPYFDQMISGMIADAIKAFARFHFENSADKKEERSFLE